MGIKNISEKTGFTRLEVKVLLFLLIVLVCGAGIKILLAPPSTKIVNFDYSAEDSLFLNSGKNGKITAGGGDKNVDYKREVLDFRKPDFTARKSGEIPAEKSINLNSAGAEILTRLPGIGPKTAGKIVDYRKQNGKFLKLDELLKVKGIGKVKFSKIKKYLYIE